MGKVARYECSLGCFQVLLVPISNLASLSSTLSLRKQSACNMVTSCSCLSSHLDLKILIFRSSSSTSRNQSPCFVARSTTKDLLHFVLPKSHLKNTQIIKMKISSLSLLAFGAAVRSQLTDMVSDVSMTATSSSKGSSFITTKDNTQVFYKDWGNPLGPVVVFSQ